MAEKSLPKCAADAREYPSFFFPLTSHFRRKRWKSADAFITKGDPPDVLIEKIQNLRVVHGLRTQ